jgi:hypothetical protein
VKITCVFVKFFHKNLNAAKLQSLSKISRFFQGNSNLPKTALHFLWRFLSFRFLAMEKGQIGSLNIAIFCELLECDLEMATSTTPLWINQSFIQV